MADDSSKALSRGDLFLLLESYKNTIEMNTTLIEQQRFLMDSQSKILHTQDDIYKKQKELCDSISKVTIELGHVVDTLQKFSDNATKDCKDRQDNILKEVGEVKSQVTNQIVAETKHDSGMKLRLYTAMGGSIGVFGSLIALIILLVTKYNGIMNILKAIAKHLGMGA